MKQAKLKGKSSCEDITADIHRLKCLLASHKNNNVRGINIVREKYENKLLKIGGKNHFNLTKLYADEKAQDIIRNDKLTDLTKGLEPVR